jgi:HK97 gp10 family phage protein
VTISIEFEGIEEFRRNCQEAAKELDAGLYSAVKEAAEAGALEARTNHPYTNRTGMLEANTVALMLRQGFANYEGEIFANREYASYVNDGTSRSRPYPFMPQAEAKARQVFDFITGSTVARVLAILNR